MKRPPVPELGNGLLQVGIAEPGLARKSSGSLRLRAGIHYCFEKRSMSDDYARNYEQEAIDDQAGFDLHNDLETYYRAMKRIEMAWEDVPQPHQRFAQHGIRDEPHYHQVQATHDRFIQSPQA